MRSARGREVQGALLSLRRLRGLPSIRGRWPREARAPQGAPGPQRAGTQASFSFRRQSRREARRGAASGSTLSLACRGEAEGVTSRPAGVGAPLKNEGFPHEKWLLCKRAAWLSPSVSPCEEWGHLLPSCLKGSVCTRARLPAQPSHEFAAS